MTNSIQNQNTLDSDNREQNFGQILRQKREEKKLSLSDVYEQIRINKRVLQAFENNNFSNTIDEYSDPVYLRAYLQKYCAFLGLKDNAFAEFNIYPTKNKSSEATHSVDSGNITLGSIAISEQQRNNKGRVILFSIITLGILFSVIFIIWNSLGTNSIKVDEVDKTSTVVDVQELPKDNKEVTDKNIASQKPLKVSEVINTQPIEVDNKVNSESEAKASNQDNEENKTDYSLPESNANQNSITSNTHEDNVVSGSIQDDQSENKQLVPQEGIYIKTELKDVWIGVKVDNRWIKMHTVKKGQDYSYVVPLSYSKYLLKLGVAKGVTVFINGQEAKLPTNSDRGISIIVNDNQVTIQ